MEGIYANRLKPGINERLLLAESCPRDHPPEAAVRVVSVERLLVTLCSV
jgi:hypothetical protein